MLVSDPPSLPLHDQGDIRMKYFSSFRFEENDGTLFQGARKIPLTRKAGNLLRCLLEHSGTVTAHKTILDTVWRDTHVQPGNIKVLIRELRRALGDDPRRPRFIRSEPARGYTFVATASEAPLPGGHAVRRDRAPIFVNRRAELEKLEHCLAAVGESDCRVVLIEGERGIGKTALCDAFLHVVRQMPATRLSYGQCVEQTKTCEPYFAMLNALERLARQFPVQVPRLLMRHAPGWLRLLPQWSRMAPRTSAVAPYDHRSSRMIREIMAALEELSREATLVLVLEDLHWGDIETVDLLRALARHHTPAKFLIVATYVGSEVSPTADALTRLAGDLQTLPSGWMPLGPLTEAHIRGYLEARFGTAALDGLARPLCKMTGGSPLRLVTAIDTLVATGRIGSHADGWRLEFALPNPKPPLHEGLSAPMLWPGTQSRMEDELGREEAAFVGSELFAGTTGRLGRTP
jgi:DNA-binding winged helix-turn-helix (wHTH) protein